MADGTTTPISQIKLGDHVLAADPNSQTNVSKAVTDRHVNDHLDLVDVKVAVDGDVSELKTTASHPFFDVTNNAWVDAKDLTPGDRLRTADGDVATVVGVALMEGRAYMHDLTVADLHTYFVSVGSESVLVHNCELADRAKEINNMVKDPRTRRNSTVAVVRAERPDGSVVDIVAGSGRRNLGPSQRAALKPNEEAAVRSGQAKPWGRLHAEQKALVHARRQGYTPISAGTSRNICLRCNAMIKRYSGSVTGPKYRPGPKKTTLRRSARFVKPRR